MEMKAAFPSRLIPNRLRRDFRRSVTPHNNSNAPLRGFSGYNQRGEHTDMIFIGLAGYLMPIPCTRPPFGDANTYESPTELPRCECGGGIRPHICWFGEVPFELIESSAPSTNAQCSWRLGPPVWSSPPRVSLRMCAAGHGRFMSGRRSLEHILVYRMLLGQSGGGIAQPVRCLVIGREVLLRPRVLDLGFDR